MSLRADVLRVRARGRRPSRGLAWAAPRRGQDRALPPLACRGLRPRSGELTVEQRRLLLAFGLSLLLLTLYQEFVLKRYPKHPAPSTVAEPQEQGKAAVQPAEPPSPLLGALAGPAEAEGGVVVETDVF